MSKIKCICGASYQPKQAWIHSKCTSSQSTPATNNDINVRPTEIATNADERLTSAATNKINSIQSTHADKTPNRRNRADYNAYQREYMRKRRLAN